MLGGNNSADLFFVTSLSCRVAKGSEGTRPDQEMIPCFSSG
jgi:hypothetical protein